MVVAEALLCSFLYYLGSANWFPRSSCGQMNCTFNCRIALVSQIWSDGELRERVWNEIERARSLVPAVLDCLISIVGINPRMLARHRSFLKSRNPSSYLHAFGAVKA